ncbi:Phosphatidylinositol 4-kinase beta 1 [Acorus calamus]|uniref:Phosphatidylinositol 4-kinase beta 1 n=1 Tax=Acorus calamus TaxID=4465 RepID=A0AAV9DIW3_ACOCL|nr:Phosphatidylinositol 4-kinase beta 1 [Acorus calamus]
MVRLLGLARAASFIGVGGGDGEGNHPREIDDAGRSRVLPSSSSSSSSSVGEAGWLVRFFDSSFFCEWIAVSYLYKHDHAGVRDYLCNRMYALPLHGIESYLFQICYMLIHKPSPSLDKFVIDMCSKSLKIALKVHWILMAEIEESDDTEGSAESRRSARSLRTLMGEWPPLVRGEPPPPPATPLSSSSNKGLGRFLSSKQRLLSRTTSSPSSAVAASASSPGGSSSQNVAAPAVGPPESPGRSEDHKLLKKLMPGPKVRDALFFRKSVEREEEEAEKDGGFFKRLLRDSKDEEEGDKEGFFKRLLRDSKDEEEGDKEGFFKRLLRDSKDDEEGDKEGFFKRLLKDSKDEEEEALTASSDGFFKRLFRDSKGGGDSVEGSKSGAVVTEEDEKEGFFKKLFRDNSKKEGGTAEEEEKGGSGGMVEEEEGPDFLSFRRLFRVHPEEAKCANESGGVGSMSESSPGTENFFRRLFRDRDRSVEDSELFASKKQIEKHPGSPRQRNEKLNPKPPLPSNTTSQIRKGTYHASLEFVQSLCDTSYGLVDIFPVEDRKTALRESLQEINSHIAAAQDSGGVCFPMGKGMYRVVHIPEDEAVLLNSREKAPYLICVEVLKGEAPSHTKETFDGRKLSRSGIPLANGDAQLQKPPPWAYPLWNLHDHHSGNERMLRSTSDAIDQAMTQLWEAKVKFVRVAFSIEKQPVDHSMISEAENLAGRTRHCNMEAASLSEEASEISSIDVRNSVPEETDVEWVRVTLSSVPGVNMEDVDDQEPPRKKEHRRVPSTIAIEEVKVGLLLQLKDMHPLVFLLRVQGRIHLKHNRSYYAYKAS